MPKYRYELVARCIGTSARANHCRADQGTHAEGDNEVRKVTDHDRAVQPQDGDATDRREDDVPLKGTGELTERHQHEQWYEPAEVYPAQREGSVEWLV